MATSCDVTVEIVNPVPADEAEPWVRQLGSSLMDDVFASSFPARVERRRRMWIPERTWGVRDNGRWVGTFNTQPRVLTVPGPGPATRDLTVDAVTGVSVAATHRRRGLLSDMIGRSLADARARGDAISMLIAAEWPIYGRFGYAPATAGASYHVDPRRGGLAVDTDRTRVREVEREQARPLADAVFDAARRRRAGQVDRHGSWWDRAFGLDGYELLGDAYHLFVHEGPDGADGFVTWRATKHADLNELAAVTVGDLFAANSAAERDLWGYLAGLDVVGDIEFWGAVDDPAPVLFTDGRAFRRTDQVDMLWIKLLDVPAALAARSYATDGEVVLDVRDPTMTGCGAGRVRLTADAGAATCQPTDDDPDVTLDQRTLASIYLGGFSLRALAGAVPIDEHTVGAIDRLSVMFSTPVAPFTQTGF